MENLEKCTVAMLGGLCSQHVTGNTSRLNHPQSAIIRYMWFTIIRDNIEKANSTRQHLIESAELMDSLQWHHNEHDGVSNHQCLNCLPDRLFRRKSKKTAKLRFIGLCDGNSPVTGEFPAQRASNAEIISVWWRHHICCIDTLTFVGLIWRLWTVVFQCKWSNV